ncbi:nitrate/nitrite transporter [Pseudomonas sp. CC6-YY-74]|uniref:MFS transporter n=1 Tax=Pseudomonas sp. CC6-YY-74 TaxID=1930532 RepID=UPI001C45B693|nr:MFS transporter [Pseudomonas sp. CC6-YY-74]
MPITFGMNQIVSHGFGMFLFAALMPYMRESIDISNWQLATIGALTQLAYLAGAMLLGVLGHRLGTGRLALLTGITSSSLLLTMAQLHDPTLITLVLTCLAASAAISWGCIVEILSRCARPELRSTYLSCASSGTAWGYALNGLLILLVVPMLGWQRSWQVAGLFGALVVGFTWHLLRNLESLPVSQLDRREAVIPTSRLFATIIGERTALFACLICLLVGFTTMPFSYWLNSYLDELMLPAALGGFTWATVGGTGMVAGFITGKLADRRGHGTALMVIFSGFALGLLAFVYDPGRYALIAGFGYGLMYFPMWGIVAGWVNQHYSSTATMQISGICMVTFGLGGTLGNLLAGYIRETTGSLQSVFLVLTGASLLLVALAIVILRSNRKALAANPATADAC